MAAILDFFEDQVSQPLSGNWVRFDFSNVMTAQSISNDTSSGPDLEISWDGGNTHFKTKAGETFVQDLHRRNKVFLRTGTGLYSSGVDFRISAWADAR